VTNRANSRYQRRKLNGSKNQATTPRGENSQYSSHGGVTRIPEASHQNNNGRHKEAYADEILEVAVNKQDLATPKIQPSLPEMRESNAVNIAKLIIYLFGASLLFSLVVVIALIILAIYLPDAIFTKVLPNIGSFLEVIKIIGALFSSLLAFILGYYFSQTIKSNH